MQPNFVCDLCDLVILIKYSTTIWNER